MRLLLISLILCGCVHREDRYKPEYNTNGITVLVIHSQGGVEILPSITKGR
jgi:hypothetical protein